MKITPETMLESEKLSDLSDIVIAIQLLRYEACKSGKRHPITSVYPTVWQTLADKRDRLHKEIKHLADDETWELWSENLRKRANEKMA